MMNHFEMQQLIEAKKMEINRQIQEQSYYLQLDKNDTKSSLFELFKKMFKNRSARNEIKCNSAN
jgi:uncharacterized protein YcgL (UPF0745 family)